MSCSSRNHSTLDPEIKNIEFKKNVLGKYLDLVRNNKQDSRSNCRSQWPRGLRRGSVATRFGGICGFEFHNGHSYMSLVGGVCVFT